MSYHLELCNINKLSTKIVQLNRIAATIKQVQECFECTEHKNNLSKQISV